MSGFRDRERYHVEGEYPDNWIADMDGCDVITAIIVHGDDDTTDYMQILCDALNSRKEGA